MSENYLLNVTEIDHVASEKKFFEMLKDIHPKWLRAKVNERPNFIIWTNLVVLSQTMRLNGSEKEDAFRFLLILGMAATLVMQTEP